MVQETLSVNEAASALRVSRRTVYNWMESGALPFLLLPSGARRIRPADLLRQPNEPNAAAAENPGK